jgi:WD40 repeat protein
VRVWDLASGAPLGEPLTGHYGGVRAVAFGELDGRAIALSGGEDGTVRIHELIGNPGSTLTVGSTVHAVAFTQPSAALVGADAGLMWIDFARSVVTNP